MTSLTPIGGGRTLTSADAVPTRRTEEWLVEIARELMTVTAMLRSAELRNQACSAETVERAKQALTAATPEARQALRAACEPSTLVELGERIAALIQSVPQGDPANAYGAALPWPKPPSGRRPARAPGAHVLLRDGEPLLYVERGGRSIVRLVELDEADLAGAAQALADAVGAGRLPKLAIEKVDGEPVIGSGHEEALLTAGFSRGPRKLTASAR